LVASLKNEGCMGNNLSHSSVSKYLQCGEAFRLHYQERLRPNVMAASLPFGSAIDAGINALLLGEGDAEEKFIEEFKHSVINGTRMFLITHEHLVYADADYDAELLMPEDLAWCHRGLEFLPQYGGEILDVYDAIRKKKKDVGYAGLTDKEKMFYNSMNWHSMKQKGLLMIAAYRKKIMPRISKVHVVQQKINLDNGAGDSVVGYVDLVADLDGATTILDNKTSASDYDEAAVLTSAQLSLYVHALGEQYNTRKAGYIVMKKNIIKNRTKVCSHCQHDGTGSRAKTCDNTINGKRCGHEWIETISPDVHIQVITDNIPEKTEALIMENIDAVNSAIKAGHFTKNLASCLNTYGQKCPYLSYCYRGDKKDLVKV